MFTALFDMFAVPNTMLEDGRNGHPTNIQRRNKETEFWNTSWIFPYVCAARRDQWNEQENKNLTLAPLASGKEIFV